MNVKKIRQLKISGLLFVLLYVFSWLVVPFHLQNINRCSASDVCNEYKKDVYNLSIDASYSKFHGSRVAAKLHKLLKHDESQCPICSLAQTKLLLDSKKSQAIAFAMDWLPLYREKIDSFFSTLTESIRAPPLTNF